MSESRKRALVAVGAAVFATVVLPAVIKPEPTILAHVCIVLTLLLILSACTGEMGWLDWVLHVVRPSETERAARELEVILDKRAAQLIREYGLSADEARRKAERDYKAEMTAATTL